MSEAFTIKIFVPDGNPDGVKIVDRMNWTGVGIAFPRASWQSISSRAEFGKPGVYILSGPGEGTSDDLPTIYIGQGEEIRNRIASHYTEKDFWDWGYAFVSNGTPLNRAHITWLEHSLIQHAEKAGRSHPDNGNSPKEPALSESEKADTEAFLREMLRILPLLGVKVFEKPIAIRPSTLSTTGSNEEKDDRDTVVVPAQSEGFKDVFLGQDCWYAIRIGGGMLPKIKFIAAYQTLPISAITHFAKVEKIEPYGDEGKYRLIFSEPAKPLPKQVPFSDAPSGSMQGPRYTSLKKLLEAKRISDIL